MRPVPPALAWACGLTLTMVVARRLLSSPDPPTCPAAGGQHIGEWRSSCPSRSPRHRGPDSIQTSSEPHRLDLPRRRLAVGAHLPERGLQCLRPRHPRLVPFPVTINACCTRGCGCQRGSARGLPASCSRTGGPSRRWRPLAGWGRVSSGERAYFTPGPILGGARPFGLEGPLGCRRCWPRCLVQLASAVSCVALRVGGRRQIKWIASPPRSCA